jgi:DNA helicase-2/ATP-dependent DNA helicase PcrA
MQANNHPDYKEEQKQLQMTIAIWDQRTKILVEEVEERGETLQSLRRSGGGGYSNEYEIAAHLYEMAAREHGMLERSSDKPYFARIDFLDDGNEKTEVFYIGRVGVENPKDGTRLILDWRAPMASLYYRGELGEVMYKAPDGLVMGELQRKRQYEIEARQLMNIFDKDLTPMDEFLQKALWQKKDNRLKDIVSTIQEEQDGVIRAEKDRVVLTQGVAGSGKTTILLHRIAYLLYTYQEELPPESILLLVPNHLFLTYIQEVLPELGVDQIQQGTYEEVVLARMELPDRLHWHQEGVCGKLKGDLRWIQVMEAVIAALPDLILPEEDLEFQGVCLFSAEEIRRIFHEEYAYLPIGARFERMKKHIRDQWNAKRDDAYGEWTWEIRENESKTYDERDAWMTAMKKDGRRELRKTLKRWPTLSALEAEEIWRSRLGLYQSSLACFSEEEQARIRFESDRSREDLPILFLLHQLLWGRKDSESLRHVVIDEAQDYSPLQMETLKRISKGNSFTIVGDVAQQISATRGITDWKEIWGPVFPNIDVSYQTLETCYRSTTEIMAIANQVLASLKRSTAGKAQVLLRHGEDVTRQIYESQGALIRDFINRIRGWRTDGLQTIAVITRTWEEAEWVHETMVAEIPELQLLHESDPEYKGGLVVLPVRVAKGLEFDGVLLYEPTKGIWPEEDLHLRQLYVASTRALHMLHLGGTNEWMDALKEA